MSGGGVAPTTPAAPSQTLGGHSRCGWVLGPSLDKIIKNVAWRKHSQLVAACKSALDKLDSLVDDPLDPASCSPLYGLSPSDADFVLQPLILALDSASPKVVEPALDCTFRLFSFGLIRCEIEIGTSPSHIFRIIDSVCKCGALDDEAVELALLRVLLSAVRSPYVLIRGDCLVHIVRSCYNVYLGGLNGTNQICAKSVLAQMMILVFTRVEENSMTVHFKTISVAELLEFTDRNLNEGSSIQFAQDFINEIVDAKAKEILPDSKLSLLLENGNIQSKSEIVDDDESREGVDLGIYSKIREDGFMLFKNLCKLSMKFSSPEHSDDQILLRGKILSLELLKVVMDNAGPIWRSSERFLNAIKQFLCLSLLKNSALSVMTIFQLLCSIFENLLSKYRSGLKSEIGIFFPMLILRVLENVLQPSFLQKMTVLSLLEKISQDPQIIIDIFVNYDCDVDAPNIFERTVNGLLKTALGPPPGSTTSLSPAQDMTFRLESVKCLVRIINSMGAWMDQQLKVGESNPVKFSDSESKMENITPHSEEGNLADFELHLEASSEFSNAVTLEQRRAYKLEIQKGVSLFNRKPSKGIDFLMNNKKIGNSPEEVASFLKNTSGLNATMIGDYLGEREEFPLKVMHAYVDSFNFEQMDFGEAIRYFLRGFRLPGEAQKIDRIMEKFAERYCKCNPNSFTSAETAYVLAYSVIMLNTDAHNNMVKDKMTKADFIRNNRGIDNGKDLPEDYLGSLYDQIVKNEIKMNADSSAQQSKQGNSLNKLLGLEGILNLVWKQTEEKPLGTNGDLIRHIQEQFKAKSAKSESIFYTVANPAILRFMVEVCWGPMLAAFSVTLDQSDDKTATALCLQGFRHAVHVTAFMGMQTQRDAFVTTVAKFTYLHCAADMKQKNVDAVKAIISIAIEDGNFLQESWEHILTCLSRFEHLQLLGEGAPSDASFLTTATAETEEKALKSASFPSLKRKGTLQNPAVAAVVRGGSYDSTRHGVNSPVLVSPEQINNFISNLNLLDQIGNFELNHIFAHSQRLNSEAIVAFVRALCKVSMSELQSPTDPRVFSLTKIVEVAHYNMNRIRLVWSRIWSVLSNFFVAVGLSENLSVAIFVMDSLRQLAMKFLEREELANYNFQNEFLRPFVIVMQKSSSAEIRELIVRCISQMVLSRVNHVKSGWKSVFMVFTAAATDERKNIVLLAFETMEKIVREYFPYITETETVTFTDCVRCLIAFTNSRFNSDVSLNAIAFLRFCAVKLADGGLVCNEKTKDNNFSIPAANDNASDVKCFTDEDDHMSFWHPLLTGLSGLTSDPRSAIRKSALEVLFNILKDHGHLFSQLFWVNVFNSVIFPIFSSARDKTESELKDYQSSPRSGSSQPDGRLWDSETSTVAAQCLADIFISFYDVARSQLPGVISILVGFIRSPGQGPASTGVSSLIHLAGELRGRLSEEEWQEIFLALQDAAASSVPNFLKLLQTMDNIEMPDISESNNDMETSSEVGSVNDDSEGENLQTAGYVVSRMKGHIAAQLLIVQVASDLSKMRRQSISAETVTILLGIYSSISSHAHQLNSDGVLELKLQRACSILEIPEPPLLHFENESYQNYINFLHDLLVNNRRLGKEKNLEPELVSVCEKILRIYLDCAGLSSVQQQAVNKPKLHWIPPLGSAKKEELAARTPLVLSVLHILSSLEGNTFKKYASQLFPLLVDLVRSEHSSGEVQRVLSGVFQSCIGPIIMNI
ncbi:brefeldin A-inhibited guanine nucleotide-exchange protein 1 [Ipomoea triloba]|uniref:brefeldin A-inhibited guanine nucleotide-exchange protein 1 n=1 Tax=Ipomoea triloba TaxID=35885 RepID=UPI00125D21B4|nr:brefeldin A-inhibited guanine nucleotide-exchange protein 1 [Ipomoea triloba]XP_031128389.1 brefeldin A-inhibited guanine nucleotide-exchange protein 1 [Ipomoea triloba]GMC83504.1 brefeldin A-inhibited guanine nucleotide-exchange protein 1 [Ipomoea batatas]